MAVAEAADTDAAEEVEIVVAVFIAQVHAFAADEEDGVAFVGVKEQILLCSLNGLQFAHATMTSVPSLTRVETRSGSRDAASAGRMRTRLTPWVRASRQALSLGSIPPETIWAFSIGGI